MKLNTPLIRLLGEGARRADEGHRLRCFALLVLLLAPAALAQSDLSIDFGPLSDRLRAGERAGFGLAIENRGPQPAEDVVIVIDIPGKVVDIGLPTPDFTCSEGKPIHCTTKRLNPSVHGYAMFVLVELPIEEGIVHANAAIGSETPDPTYANNFTHVPTRLVAQPDLFAEALIFQTRVDPATRSQFLIAASNFSGTPAENTRLTATLPDGGTIVDYRATHGTVDCTISGNSITCDLGTLHRDGGRTIEVDYTTPERLTGGRIRVISEATSSGEDFNPGDNRDEATAALYRWLVVDNTSDDGEGSLRRALTDTAGCSDPCKVAFRIPAPVPDSGWFTIRPRSPLPPASGDVIIDGGTQSVLTGDTNAEGPEIEINGALAGPASGLTLAGSCDMRLNMLAINGFDGHGVDVVAAGRCNERGFSPWVMLTLNSIGTDPRGREAVPNRRGVVVSGDARVTINNNIISGNARAGVFVHRAMLAELFLNKIGVGRNGEAIGNGGTGVYIDDAPADVERNTIAHNGESGVGRIAGGAEIGIVRNSIFDNGTLGIDIGLDFETPPVERDTLFPNPPVLLSATYDAATNVTTVRGRFATAPRGYAYNVELFASRAPNRSGRVEGERFLGETRPSWEPSQDFTFQLQEDLTGQFITATATRLRPSGFAKPLSHRSSLPNNTSELSNAVQVTR